MLLFCEMYECRNKSEASNQWCETSFQKVWGTSIPMIKIDVLITLARPFFFSCVVGCVEGVRFQQTSFRGVGVI